MATKKNILREIFSGANGKLSAKRVIGGIAMAVALGCTIYLVISDGSNTVVENLLMTIFITSVSLLGLPAVTSVWGNSKLSVVKQIEEYQIVIIVSIKKGLLGRMIEKEPSRFLFYLCLCASLCIRSNNSFNSSGTSYNVHPLLCGLNLNRIYCHLST